MAVRKHVLEVSGDPALEGNDRRVQRGLDGVSEDLRELEAAVFDAQAFGGSGSVWATPTPTTTQEAITRMAAAVAGLLGTPIP